MGHGEFVKKVGAFISPAEMVRLVAMEQVGLTKADFFNNPEHQPLKDAWQAAVLSSGYQAVSGKPILVRLSSQEQFPDFEIKTDGAVHRFEAVMVLTKPLGKVYKADHSIGPVTGTRPAALPELDPAPIRAAIEKKVKKYYGPRVHLSVYLNLSGANANAKSVSRAVAEASGDTFESVWVLARGNESGKADVGAYFVLCAKPSPSLASEQDWCQVPGVNGLSQ